MSFGFEFATPSGANRLLKNSSRQSFQGAEGGPVTCHLSEAKHPGICIESDRCGDSSLRCAPPRMTGEGLGMTEGEFKITGKRFRMARFWNVFQQLAGSAPYNFWQSLMHRRVFGWFSFCFITAMAVCLPGALAHATPANDCSKNQQFTQWLQQGQSLQLPVAAREKAYEQAIEACPGNTVAYHNLSILLLQQREFEKALGWTRRGLEVAPTNPDLNLDLGVALLSLGQPEKALPVFQQLPVSARNEFYLGMAYRSLRNHQAARQAFAKSFALGDHDPYVLYALIEQDHALHDQKAGLADFKTFYEHFPQSAWLHLLLGNAYLSRRDNSHAEAEYREAVKLDPKLPIAHFYLGLIAFNRADYSLAQREFQKEVALNPTFGEAYLYLGATLRRLGRNSEALPDLQQAVAHDPNFALGYRELAAAQIEAHQLQDARRTLEEGERRFPREQAFPAQLAQLLRRLGDTPSAEKQSRLAESLSRQANPQLHGPLPGAPSLEENLKEAGDSSILSANKNDRSGSVPDLKGEPDNPQLARGASGGMKSASSQASVIERDALLGLSMTRTPRHASYASPELQRLSECIERSDRQCAASALMAIHDESLQNNSDYLDLKAQALNLLRKRTEALTVIERAIQIQPHRADYFITEGQIYQRMDRQIAAIKSFLRAEQLHPGLSAPIYDLGMSFFLLGNDNNDNQYYDRAARHFETALELDPKNDRARFMLGVVDVVEFKLDQARKEFEQALRMSPQNPYYHLHYGILLSRLGDHAGARREMQTAEKLDPSYARTYFNLGNLDAEIGSYTEAREQLEVAVRLDPSLSSAYYSLGRVYHHLGLVAKSQEAFRKFQEMKSQERQEQRDPVETSAESRAKKP